MRLVSCCRKAFRSRLFLSWFCSYLLILALPFTFFSGLFGNFAHQARQDVCESRETALWQFSRIFEQRLGGVENLAIAIFKLSVFNIVRRVGREVTSMDMYKIYLLQRSMHAIRMQQSFIQSIYIYLDSHRAAPSGYPHQQVQGGEHLPDASVPAVHVGLREPGDAVFIAINTKSLRELLVPSLQAILGQALRGRSPRSSRRANRSPTALYWTTGSVCCCSAAPKGWAGSNADPGNGSSSGKQLGLFPDRLHEGCSSFDFRGRRPDGGKALPFGAKGVGWCNRLQSAGVFRLQQSARRSAKPCQVLSGGGERFGVRPACRVSQCFLR